MTAQTRHVDGKRQYWYRAAYAPTPAWHDDPRIPTAAELHAALHAPVRSVLDDFPGMDYLQDPKRTVWPAIFVGALLGLCAVGVFIVGGYAALALYCRCGG